MSDVTDWWTTSIIDMEPGRIDIRERAIQDLIGNLSFVEMIWLMLRGNNPTKGQADLLEAALVASVDHGPQSPSIAAARMAVTCGLGLNGAMGTAVHMLDDVHGGAGQQFVSLLHNLVAEPDLSTNKIANYLNRYRQDINPYVPGFGHRFHKPVDPRAPRLIALVREASERGDVSGEFMDIAVQIETVLAEER